MMRHRPQRHVSHRPPNSQAGFSLVEGLVMLVIIGITAAVAIPNLQRAKIKTETTQAIFEVAGLFDLARGEAVKRHSPIVLIYTPGGGASEGMFHIFEDWDPENDEAAAGNGNSVFDGDEESVRRIRLNPALSIADKPAGDSSGPTTALTTVVYRPDGGLRSVGGVLYYSDDLGNVFRVRVNDVTGLARVEMWVNKTSRWSNNKRDWEWEY